MNGKTCSITLAFIFVLMVSIDSHNRSFVYQDKEIIKSLSVDIEKENQAVVCGYKKKTKKEKVVTV